MEGGITETLIHFPPLQTGLGDSPPGPVFIVVASLPVDSGQLRYRFRAERGSADRAQIPGWW